MPGLQGGPKNATFVSMLSLKQVSEEFQRLQMSWVRISGQTKLFPPLSISVTTNDHLTFLTVKIGYSELDENDVDLEFDLWT